MKKYAVHVTVGLEPMQQTLSSLHQHCRPIQINNGQRLTHKEASLLFSCEDSLKTLAALRGNNSGGLKLTSRDVMDSVEGARYGHVGGLTHPSDDSATSKLKKSFTLRSCSLCTHRGGAQIPSNKPACDSRAAAARARLQTRAKYLILFT